MPLSACKDSLRRLLPQKRGVAQLPERTSSWPERAMMKAGLSLPYGTPPLPMVARLSVPRTWRRVLERERAIDVVGAEEGNAVTRDNRSDHPELP